MKKVKHRVISIKVNALIDEDICGLVEALNLFPELQTIESCQGNKSNPCWISFYYGDYRLKSWGKMAKFVFEYLGPRIMHKVGDGANIIIRVTGSGQIQGELSVRKGAISAVIKSIRELYKEFVCSNYPLP